ncbi:MAG TPA: orotate phosphoribosyltransferase [Flavobacteriales bacterium]|jgi:orotate phosphoribosyltransferase|nr:orotate phosphoribosyltransferase [Flavobacteriales bacterium]
MITDETAAKVAEFLLQIKAVVLNPDDPFTWSSGWKSPIYCDNRKTLSYPKVRTFIRQSFHKLIDNHFGNPDVIAGVATGGIAHGALVAQDMGLPFVYVRTKSKDHGLENQIEGVIEAGQTAIVIEDLISTGKSSLRAVKALQDAGVQVKGLVAIFSYGLEIAEKNMKDAKCMHYTLSDYNTLIEQALKSGYIQKGSLDTLQKWRSSPEKWK